MRNRNRKLVLSDNSERYADAILDAFDYARGKKKINLDINTPKLQLPTVKVEPSEQTNQTIKKLTTLGYVIAGAVGILALSNLKRK